MRRRGSLLVLFSYFHRATLAVSLALVFLIFLNNLVAGLLQLVVPVIEDLLETVGFLSIAIAGECVQNLREFGLSNDRVLDFSNVLVCEYDVALVDSQLERQEKDWNCLLGAFANLELLNLAVVRIWDATGFSIF